MMKKAIRHIWKYRYEFLVLLMFWSVLGSAFVLVAPPMEVAACHPEIFAQCFNGGGRVVGVSGDVYEMVEAINDVEVRRTTVKDGDQFFINFRDYVEEAGIDFCSSGNVYKVTLVGHGTRTATFGGSYCCSTPTPVFPTATATATPPEPTATATLVPPATTVVPPTATATPTLTPPPSPTPTQEPATVQCHDVAYAVAGTVIPVSVHMFEIFATGDIQAYIVEGPDGSSQRYETTFTGYSYTVEVSGTHQFRVGLETADGTVIYDAACAFEVTAVSGTSPTLSPTPEGPPEEPSEEPPYKDREPACVWMREKEDHGDGTATYTIHTTHQHTLRLYEVGVAEPVVQRWSMGYEDVEIDLSKSYYATVENSKGVVVDNPDSCVYKPPAPEPEPEPQEEPETEPVFSVQWNEGEGGQAAGNTVGLVVIPSLGISMEMEEVNPTDDGIEQRLGVAASYMDDVGIHQGDHAEIGQDLQVGDEVIIRGVSYKVSAKQVMSKAAAGVYSEDNTVLITCTADWTANVVFTLAVQGTQLLA